MNLKVKTLHELMTMSLWLDNLLTGEPATLPQRDLNELCVLLWNINAEITERLLKKENDDNITV